MSKSNSTDYNFREIDCPSCLSEKTSIVSHVLDIPYYDDFIMVSVNCSDCGYRTSDFFNMHSKGHTRYVYNITDVSDDSTKVIRSIEGTVSIPEINTKIEPYGGGTSWIRNIEGVLEDIHNKILSVLRNENDKAKIRTIKERIKKIKQMMIYQIPFTIIVDDPTGNSLILPVDDSKLQIILLNGDQE